MASCLPRAATTSARSLGNVEASSAVSIAPMRSIVPWARSGTGDSGFLVRSSRMAPRQDPGWKSRYAIDSAYIPKDRYLSREFFELEMERLWPHVWQIACRADQVARPGDYLEYVIGDQSILVVHGDDGRLRAFHNACR